ncbi:hypothetical protein PAXRUDRAFT_287668 [Paxillus rubicundulus Ve08.2h10]|uniref:Uncharacterized protein n=1 Tax=Paxillus rubicundulus Ve08.2h10 TaxID=930991 RepID=A0A0D0DFZ3_9AGAM|nr:hypothetical protein PAXRUDRAFT_287668 [Paxillus rubicundulus Ve08.2h10]
MSTTRMSSAQVSATPSASIVHGPHQTPSVASGNGHEHQTQSCSPTRTTTTRQSRCPLRHPPKSLTHSQIDRSRPLATMDRRTELQRVTHGEMAIRKAGHDVRLGKKRPRTDAIVAALNTAGRRDLKRKEPPAEVIEVSSDSETEILPTKRHKADPDAVLAKEEEEEDYIDLLASLDISNDANWVPPPASNKAEDRPGVDPPIPQTLPPLPVPKPKSHVDYNGLPLDWYSLGQWGMIARGSGITKFPKPSHHARRQENIFLCGYKRSPKLYYDRGYNKLELTAKYPHLTSGSVNKIIQASGKVVLGSVVSAGSRDYSDDEDDQPPPPENRAGSLVVYNRGRVHVAQAHRHTRMTSRGK